ncbi:MAG: HAD family phosphatase [Ruminococcaceae bacterium]|nr:HAD family phosphatase [Oscillospiraceae bacterium]
MTSKGIYIFDLDGTLIDSMPYFSRGMLSIADDAGIEYTDELIKILTPLGYVGGAEYYINHLGIEETIDTICERVRARLLPEYQHNIPLKPGVKKYLEKLHAYGARLFVLTASPYIMAEASLKNNGVSHLFEKIWSVEDFGLTKSDTRLFFKVADTIGCEPCDIHYFDDSLIAADNAKKAGYVTYAVYDTQTDSEVEYMHREFENVVTSFESM